MRFAPVRFDLPPWSADDLQQWQDLTERARKMVRGGGRGSRFHLLVKEIVRLIEAGDLEAVDARLDDQRFARALVTVWSDSLELAERSMTPQRVSDLMAAQPERSSYLMALAMIDTLLSHFDLMSAWSEGLLESTAVATLVVVNQQEVREGAGDVVETVRRDHAFFTSMDGPRALADHLAATGTGLDDYARAAGLATHMGGRFGERLRQAYYLGQIERADHRRSSYDFLDEVVLPAVTKAPGRDGLHFGHEILQAMADKPASPASDAWLRTIMEIGGDPRMAHLDEWRTWWAPLPTWVADRVKQWIGAEDLQLFLEAVEQYGEDTYNSSLVRMFPPRKTFLMGLYDLGLVRETRLILGRRARDSIRRQMSSKYVEAALFADRHDTAVIVVDCGDFFLVEGSHNFKLWVYLGQADTTLMDRRVGHFDHHDLTISVPLRHHETHPLGWAAHDDVTHQGLWQRRALEFLIEKHGIDIDVRAVLSEQDYNTLKWKHGLPVVRRPARHR